jgi:hypothetical protein
MRFAFRVNNQEVQLSLWAVAGSTVEVVAMDSTVGEFALDGTERIEARDVKLAAALGKAARPRLWNLLSSGSDRSFFRRNSTF